jgi:hypothetical protein|tara:strand:- start:597 stop:794 length:198 start_codon:yes stop_codon:yes gene_type:complete
MKTGFYILGGTMIALGLMAVAGSANDCDGKCVETANTLGEMMFIVFWGMISITVGGLICAKTSTY